MKRKIIFYLLFLFVIKTTAQTDKNRVIVTTPLVEAPTLQAVNDLGSSDKLQVVHYLDAFGRVVQTIQVSESPGQNSIVQPFSYDQYGRQSNTYLPYTVTGNNADPMEYRANWEAEQLQFYQNTPHVVQTNFPFAQTEYVKSPLNMPARISAPGELWTLSSGHTQKNASETNDPDDNVLLLRVNENYEPEAYTTSTVQPNSTPGLISHQNFGMYQSLDWSFHGDDIYPIEDNQKCFQINGGAESHFHGPFTFEGFDEGFMYKMRFKIRSTSLGTGILLNWRIWNNGTVSHSGSCNTNDYGNLCILWHWIEIDQLTNCDILEFFEAGPDEVVGQYLQLGEVEIYKYGDVIVSNVHKPGTLLKQSVTDENGQKTEEYFDISGRKLLTRTIGTDGLVSNTYFVYDTKGRLVYTIPPMAAQVMMDNPNFVFSDITEYLFINKYDGRNRATEIKVPGKGWSYVVYDEMGRILLSQDPNQALQNKWTFYKYDVFGRVIISGTFTPNTPMNRQQVQQNYASWYSLNPELFYEKYLGTGNYFGYSFQTFPNSNAQFDILMVTFYDGYQFQTDSNYAPDEEALLDVNTLGLTTGSLLKVLDGQNNYLKTVNYYDEKKQLVESHQQNLNGKDVVLNRYDFAGSITATEHVQDFGSNHISVVKWFEYDHSKRLKKVFYDLGGDAAVTLLALQYNELGQVTKKRLHYDGTSNNYLQTIDYRYNERGWLLKINNAALVDDGDNLEDDDVFGEELIYSDNGFLTDLPYFSQFNGNISAVKWKSKAPNVDGTYLPIKLYTFEYDGLNRLRYARSAETTPRNSANFNEHIGEYNEFLSYDLNGNILTLERYNDGQGIDLLDYNYEPGSNRINYIHDNWNWPEQAAYKQFPSGVVELDEYDYDANGNMIQDDNKGISLAYNPINLIEEVTKPGYDAVHYLYDATGRRLSKTIGTAEPYYYVNGVEYNNGALVQLYTEEGVVRPTPADATNTTDYVFDYHIKDHLQNVRVVISNQNATHRELLVTHEVVRSAIEEGTFENVDVVRADKPLLMPTVNTYGANNKTGRLSAQNNQGMGPSRVMPVHQGDVVDAQTLYWYDDIEPNTGVQSLSQILSQMVTGLLNVGQGVLPAGEQGTSLFLNTSSSAYLGLATFVNSSFQQVDLSQPQAFMVWIKLDARMNVEQEQSGFLQVSEGNTLGTLQKQQLIMNTEGYLFMYLINSSTKKVDFDNFDIIIQTASVLEMMDYYPFGLAWHVPGSGAASRTDNKFWHTSKEMQSNEWGAGSGIDLEDFGARMYDPAVGRWWSVDPLADMRMSLSSYNYCSNNPILRIDLTGALDGDYYDINGNYLGNDAINDQKVYVADGVDNTKTGKDAFINARDLGVTHSTFLKLASVINQESSGDYKESMAIGTTIVNAKSNNGNISLESLIGNSNFTKAILDKNYQAFLQSPNNAKYAITSSVNALLYMSGERFNAFDYSYGAILWEGGQLAALGANHYHSKFYGMDVLTGHWQQFKTFYENQGSVMLNTFGVKSVADIHSTLNPVYTAYWINSEKSHNYRILISSTVVHGGTMFFGPNTGDPRNVNFNWSDLSKYK